MTAPTVSTDDGLAAALRVGTMQAHDDAEHSTFMTDLTGGKLSVEAVNDFNAQLHAIYSAIEQVAAGKKDSPDVGAFVDPALDRTASLEQDLVTLGGPDWAEKYPVGPAAQAYRERILGDPSDQAFVAHHYTRYLGDLSGGLSIGVNIRRHYGIDRLAFYEFPEIPEPVPYKRAYRAKLDAVQWTPEQVAEAVQVAKEAFALNSAVFAELSARHPAPAE